MARMTLAYNAERTDVLCAQMSGLMRRQSLQHFQAPPDEIRANRKAERHFDKLNDKFCSAHRGTPSDTPSSHPTGSGTSGEISVDWRRSPARWVAPARVSASPTSLDVPAAGATPR